jgi:hypothetical protein
VRLSLLTAVLLVVLAASALNLVLGGEWVVALGVILLARRPQAVAWLLLVVTGVGVAGAFQLGWLRRPAPVSYAGGELAWLRTRIGSGAAPRDPSAAAWVAVRARLGAVRAEELSDTARELERRAVLLVAASRELGPLRGRAPAEVKAVEEAARQVALTLTAPEFRDLEGRWTRLADYLAALEARLAARDEAAVAEVARGLERAALARLSLAPLRADLAAAEAALAAAVQAVSGAAVTLAPALHVEYDEGSATLVTERRYLVEAVPPVRVVQLDAAGFDEAPAAAGAPILLYDADRTGLRPFAAGGTLSLGEGGAARLLVVERRVGLARTRPIRPALRLLSFVRLEIAGGPARWPDLAVTVSLEPGGSARIPLRLRAGPGRLGQLTLPRDAFHHAGMPGTVQRDGTRDVWVPDDPTAAARGLAVELVPATRLLRNPGFAGVKDYLYTPNTTAALGVVGLAALAGALVARRPRPAPPAGVAIGAVRR